MKSPSGFLFKVTVSSVVKMADNRDTSLQYFVLQRFLMLLLCTRWMVIRFVREKM